MIFGTFYYTFINLYKNQHYLRCGVHLLANWAFLLNPPFELPAWYNLTVTQDNDFLNLVIH